QPPSTPFTVFLSPAATRRSDVSDYCRYHGYPDAHDERAFCNTLGFGPLGRDVDRHVLGGLVSDASCSGRVSIALLRNCTFKQKNVSGRNRGSLKQTKGLLHRPVLPL